ncbi:MAG: ABC transporter ATP-binding protein [Bacilli bacterium]|nr:ABC transporter ATP-binding protein [Bacilli bacterium]MDE6141352.1 ABC transporter ATP-binding protein [Bacilli bacterium]
MIKVEHLKKEFTKTEAKKKRTKFLAVDDVTFEAKEGKVIGILGHNGAGKTTLLRMIAGIMEPTSGTIEFDEKTYSKSELDIKKELAYLSGNTKIYQSISPYELLKMCCEFYDMKESQIDKRIKEISKRLKMDKFLYNRIDRLSTGQMQKVNIARSFIHDPKYYILDEVTSGLDIISSQIILDFIKEEKKNKKCILYSTHYMEEAENICDECIMINHGSIIATGTPDEIKKETKTTNLRDAFFALIGGSYEE